MNSQRDDFSKYFQMSQDSFVDDNSFFQNIDSMIQSGGDSHNSEQSLLGKLLSIDSTPITNSEDVSQITNVIPLSQMSCGQTKPPVETMYEQISPELLDSSDPSLQDSTTTTPAPTDSSTLPDIMSTTTTKAPEIPGDPFSQSGGSNKQHTFDQANDSRQFEPNLTDSSDYWNDVLLDSCDSMDCQTDTTDWSTTELETFPQQGGGESNIESSSLPIYTGDSQQPDVPSNN
tara:strand:+ start:2463 stop:3155 length:693 start_codon:yes stop_codon:yes gene_type:complete